MVNNKADKKCKERQNVDSMNLMIAYMLSFNIKPANSNDIEEFDSLCTSGNQQQKGNDGILIRSGIIRSIINIDINCINQNTSEKIKNIEPKIE